MDVFSRKDTETNRYQWRSFMLGLYQCFVRPHGVLFYTFILNHHTLFLHRKFWILTTVANIG